MSRLSCLALRSALRALLAQDATLAAMGGAGLIHDDAPRNAALPHLAFGETRWRDWSSATDRGGEEFLTLDIWSDYQGSREALELAERIAQVIESATHIAAVGLRIVSLRVEALDLRRENGGRLMRASLRLRAVTETI